MNKPLPRPPRWRKVISDLWDDKTRTALVVASIAVGVFAIGMIITTYVILSQDVRRSYAAANPPNIEITTDPFDQAFVRAIQEVPGVELAEGRRQIEIQARQGAGSWQTLKLVALQQVDGPINRLTLLDGRPTPGPGETIVNQDVIHITGFHPGDRIEIDIDGLAPRFLTVVGLVADQTTARPDPATTNYAYITLETLEDLGLDPHFNRLVITVADEGESALPRGSDARFIAHVAAAVKDKVEKSGRTVYTADEQLTDEHPMAGSTLAVVGILGALGGLITVLSSALIINTLNAMLTQQRRQIGIMKLVGGRSRQILSMYLALILAYSLIALLIAMPLAALAGYGLAWVMAGLLGAMLQGFRVVPLAILAQALIALLIPLGAGYIPVRGGARTSVLHAISNARPPEKTAPRGGIFGRFILRGPRRAPLLSRPLLLSFRNTFRKKGRLALTLFTLSMAGAVFIAVFNVRDSMTHVMDLMMQHFLADVTLTLRQPYRVERVEQALRQVPGVAQVEAWGGAPGEIWDAHEALVTKITVVAPPEGTRLLQPDMLAGRWVRPGEAYALVASDTIYRYYPGLQPGDALQIKLPDRRVETWTVVGVFRFMAMLPEPLVYANFDFVSDRLRLRSQAASYRVVTTQHDSPGQQAISRQIDAQLKARNLPVQSVVSGAVMLENATTGLNALIIFLLIMAILTAIVGSIGLTGTMSINVLERTREIGVMRTIGAQDRVIMQSVMLEALLIGLITWLLAIGLSLPISQVMLSIIGRAMMGSSMTLHITPLGILLWLGVVIGLSLFASLAPARSAAKLTINEVLAYE